MKQQTLLLLCFTIILVGCGGEELPQPEQMESTITVIDDSGAEHQIPASDLLNEDTGKPVAKQIFVVDRQTNKKQFLDVSAWQAQSPSQMRYVPVKKESATRH